MNSKIFWELNEAYQLGVCNQEVVEEETLTEEELEGIQEWVEALVAEGYDLEQYTDDELCEAYLEELYQGRHGQSATQYMAGRSDSGKRISGDDKTGPRYYTLGRARGVSPDFPTQPGQKPVNTPKLSSSEKQYHEYNKSSSSSRAKYSKIGGSKGLPEELDLYDIVSDYLVSEGFCDSYDDASVIMANMSEEWRDSIMEEVVDEAKKYETHLLKGVPEKVHGTVKKAVRSQTKQKSEPTTRQKVLGHKLSSLRDRNDESDEPVRGSKRGAESPTDR
jgi:hypothetical protein